MGLMGPSCLVDLESEIEDVDGLGSHIHCHPPYLGVDGWSVCSHCHHPYLGVDGLSSCIHCHPPCLGAANCGLGIDAPMGALGPNGNGGIDFGLGLDPCLHLHLDLGQISREVRTGSDGEAARVDRNLVRRDP